MNFFPSWLTFLELFQVLADRFRQEDIESFYILTLFFRRLLPNGNSDVE
jgi:hypothetical protein